MFQLQYETPPQWAKYVCQNLDDFLIDHAACERKASATAMSFVVRYRDMPKLIKSMIVVAQEELEHFAQVTDLILERGLQLGADEKDPYVNAMLNY